MSSVAHPVVNQPVFLANPNIWMPLLSQRRGSCWSAQLLEYSASCSRELFPGLINQPLPPTFLITKLIPTKFFPQALAPTPYFGFAIQGMFYTSVCALCSWL